MNPFKHFIWKSFWENYTERDTEKIIELLVKEAVGKLPQHKLEYSDRLKVRRIDLDFSGGKTLLQINEHTNIIDIGPVNNMTCFVSLINIDIMSISYFNPKVTVEDNSELSLETSLKKTNLFKSFKLLKSVELIEHCVNGIRKTEVKRRDVI